MDFLEQDLQPIGERSLREMVFRQVDLLHEPGRLLADLRIT